ncbi:MAG: zf-HC2 domain-containing protein [Candidatus Sulfotelmatobacter sp.]
MDHNQAVREKATERYLLNELDPDVRDQFEEHLFDCQDCALDLRTTAMFVEQGKVVLSEKPEAVLARVPVAVPAPSGWFGWMRPAFAAPVLALLLVVIGYQGVTNARLRHAAGSPQLLASAVINVGTRSATVTQVSVHPGEAFQLSINVPPDHYSSYKLDLYSSQGGLEWSRTVSASGSDPLSLMVPGYDPGSDHVPGALAVHGITVGGESVDLGRYRIEFQN